MENTYLIDDFIKEKAIVKESSYSLTTPRGSSDLLYPILYDLNLKINEVYKKKIPTKELMKEKVKKGFFEVFKKPEEYYIDWKKKEKMLNDKINNKFDSIIKEILDLREDWDGYGAKSYKIKTINRCKTFLHSLLSDFIILFNLELDFPLILPGINGDIDLEWKTNKFHLLISIPESDQELAGAYGTNYVDDDIKIDFDLDKPNIQLLAWLGRQYVGMGD